MMRSLNFRRLTPAPGVTLVELVIAIAVLAILTAIALPSFQSTIRSNRLATSTNQLVSAISLARSEAIRNTRGAGVCSSNDGVNCVASSDWSGGWLVWSDVNGNGTFDAGTDIALRYMQGNRQVVVAGPEASDAVRYDRRGRLAAGADVRFSLQPQECGSQKLLRNLTLTRVGQLQKELLASCP